MKRKSLEQKINEITQVGSLQSYLYEDAVKNFKDAYGDNSELLSKELEGLEVAYGKGKCLCKFTPYAVNIDSGIETVRQLNTLPGFVKDIVWYMINNEFESQF